MNLFDRFFEKDGSKCLMVFFQDGDAPSHGEITLVSNSIMIQ